MDSTTPCHITKRARANTTGKAHNIQWDEDKDHKFVEHQHINNAERLRPYIKLSDQKELCKLLIQAIKASPTVSSMVSNPIENDEHESNRVVSFDHYTNSIWEDIDAKYSDIALNVIDDIFSSITDIVLQCGLSASPQTRFNGLSALCKIGKACCLPSTPLGHEVLEGLQCNPNPVLEYRMLDILSAMMLHETEGISSDMSSPEALVPKLLELKRLAQNNSIFEKLKVVLEVFGYERDGSGRYKEDQFSEEELLEEEQELSGEDLNEGEFYVYEDYRYVLKEKH